MELGYARVSTGDQDNAAQVDALRKAGCSRIFEEKASGANRDRPELNKLLEQLREGDVLVVWKLDRLARSTQHVLAIFAQLEAVGARFRCLTEPIDTTSAGGRMFVQMLAAFGEFERAMIVERTRAGLEAAKKAGRVGGRPAKLSADQRRAVVEMVRKGDRSMAEVGRLFGVSKSTVGRVVAAG